MSNTGQRSAFVRKPPADLGSWCDCEWLGVTFYWHQWEHRYFRMVRDNEYPGEKRFNRASIDISISEATMRLIRRHRP